MRVLSSLKLQFRQACSVASLFKVAHHRFSHGSNPLLSSVRILPTRIFPCLSEDCCHHHIQIYCDMIMCWLLYLCSVYSLQSLLAVGIQKQRMGKFYSAHITVSQFICWCTKHHNDPCELPLLPVLSSISIYLQDRYKGYPTVPSLTHGYIQSLVQNSVSMMHE